ncbi:GIY-YIG nuclease family protein [Curtobacterium citreum]|uniref:GIY-YIG nuclease family protein n=2 Tax=Curtobacterium citreum TaxID=2036 RepID=UPI003CC90FFE
MIHRVDPRVALLAAEPQSPTALEAVESPGLYAWWTAGAIPWPASFPPVDPDVPAYVGKADTESLANRFMNDHLGRTRGSALRRSLAALLAEELNLRASLIIGTRKRPSKFGLDQAGEERLTRWMLSNLSVTWVSLVDPGDDEEALIRNLHPPLNDVHAVGSMYRVPMRVLRASFAASR